MNCVAMLLWALYVSTLLQEECLSCTNTSPLHRNSVPISDKARCEANQERCTIMKAVYGVMKSVFGGLDYIHPP